MRQYLITATVQIEYLIPVEAENEDSAYQALDEWIIDDFEPYKNHAQWDFEIQDNE
jgi:hypothetical protein